VDVGFICPGIVLPSLNQSKCRARNFDRKRRLPQNRDVRSGDRNVQYSSKPVELIREFRRSSQSQLLRQADTLKFACRPFGDFGEEEDFPRRLERRETLGKEAVKLLFSGG
jgi:hypothetical protein